MAIEKPVIRSLYVNPILRIATQKLSKGAEVADYNKGVGKINLPEYNEARLQELSAIAKNYPFCVTNRCRENDML